MRPSHAENLTRFLGAALVLGVGVLSAGIGMGILQSARRKDATKALIGQWSASSLAFYWAVLALLGAQMLGRPVPVPSGVAVAALAAPLALIGFGQILAHRFRKRGDGHEGGEEEPATVMFEAVEVVMNLFANSVSFLRVAAFGLAHAALTTAVFVIEDMIRVPGSSVVSQPFEHLFIVALEGMIVTIQCLRLEYYEFFSKFFSGGGLPYAPISVDAE
jgi:V/A-type H+-transporting ATPase subunit I